MFSATFDKHLKRLEVVLRAKKSVGLTLKPEKCHSCFYELQLSSHIVNSAGIRCDPGKIAVVTHISVPSDKKAVRRFLGLCAYYRRRIEDFARMASSLTRLTRDHVGFVLNEEQEAAFSDLGQRLQTPPVLARFDEEAPPSLHTDASNVGLGAVLVQRLEGTETVITNASQTLTSADANYSTTAKERLAVAWTVIKFRTCLYGRHFRVIRDHGCFAG